MSEESNVKPVLWRKEATAMVALALLAGMASVWMVHLNRPYRDIDTPDVCFSLYTLLFADHWYQDGLLGSGAALLWNPNSVEFPTLVSRRMHSSYPPGVVLPLYLAARIARTPPTMSMIKAINLVEQYLIALLLSLTVFVLTRRIGLGRINAAILSCIPITLVFFLPAPFYEHQTGFFTYQAVLVWFAAFVFLETLRDSTASDSRRRIISIAQSVVAFVGLATDWLFAFVLFCVYVKRIAEYISGGTLRRFLKESLLYWAAPAALLGLFAIQLVALDAVTPLYYKFQERTDIAGQSFLSLAPEPKFWGVKMLAGYGEPGVALVLWSTRVLVITALIAGICLALRRPPGRVITRSLATSFVLLVPCVMYVFVFRNQCAYWLHFCEALKFTLPLAVVPLILVPVQVLGWLQPRRDTLALVSETDSRVGRIAASIACCLLLAAAAYYAHREFPRVATLYSAVMSLDEPRANAKFVADNTRYEDVVFAWEGELEEAENPFWLAYSRKRVYLVKSLAEVCEKLGPISAPYVVNFVCSTSTPSPPDAALAKIVSSFPVSRATDRLCLYKIPKDTFKPYCR